MSMQLNLYLFVFAVFLVVKPVNMLCFHFASNRRLTISTNTATHTVSFLVMLMKCTTHVGEVRKKWERYGWDRCLFYESFSFGICIAICDVFENLALPSFFGKTFNFSLYGVLKISCLTIINSNVCYCYYINAQLL